MPHPLPDYLRALMLARGYTSSALAAAIATAGTPCTRQHVDGWLGGSIPGGAFIRALGIALGADAEELAARCAGISGPIAPVSER